MKNTPSSSPENNIIENFFKILISKDFIHKNYFEIYYKSFLDKNGDFSEEKYISKLDEIYKFISENNWTSIRPNNATTIKEETIKNIIMEHWDSYKWYEKFSEELVEHFEENIDMDSDIWLNDEKIKFVKKWIENYLVKFYNESFINEKVSMTLEEFVQKIINILKQKKTN